MQIVLQEPFVSRWRNGYLVVNSENRKNVILFNSENNRTTISYARYLVCIHLGYILSDEYEVDHKDDDKTNDDFGNLQILTKEQNRLKEQYRYVMYEQEHYGFTCPVCETNFLLDKRQAYKYISTNKQPTCSRGCGRIRLSEMMLNRGL